MHAAFALLAAGLYATTITDDVATDTYAATSPSRSADEGWIQLFNR